MVQGRSSLTGLIRWITQGRVERDGRSCSLSIVDGRIEVEYGDVVESGEE